MVFTNKHVLKIILAIVGIILYCFFIAFWPGCNSNKATPEEKAQEKARIAIMEVSLYKVQVGDFLEFKSGRVGLVTQLANKACRYSITPAMKHSERRYYDYLASSVIAIHKRGSNKVKELAILYCNQSLN